MNKFFYKNIPVEIILSEGAKRISVNFNLENLSNKNILKNYMNLNNLDINKFQTYIKEYIDKFVVVDSFWVVSMQITLKEFIDEKIEDSKEKSDTNLEVDSSSLFWSDETKKYVFWKKPSWLDWYSAELTKMINHIIEHPKSENLLEINQNIKGMCNWIWDWGWIYFDRLKRDYPNIFSELKSSVEKLALTYPYTKFDDGPINYTIWFMLNQWSLFNNKDFSFSEFEKNASFLDKLVENWTVKNIMADKKTPSDYKPIFLTKIEQFSNYKDITATLTESWKFQWNDLKELTVKDFLSVIYSDFEKELLNKRGESYLSFKTALNYFYNLEKSNDSIKTILSDIKIIFEDFKADFPEDKNYFINLAPEEAVKTIAKIFVKTIISNKLLKENLLYDFFLENDFKSQYYWQIDDWILKDLYNYLFKTEKFWNPAKSEMKLKGPILQNYLSNKNIIFGINIKKINFTASTIKNFNDSKSIVLSKDLIDQLVNANSLWDKIEIARAIFPLVESKKDFETYIYDLFNKADFDLQKVILDNVSYFTDISVADKLFSDYFNDTNKYEDQLIYLFFKSWLADNTWLLSKIIKFWDSNKISNFFLNLFENKVKIDKSVILNKLEKFSVLSKDDKLKLLILLDKENSNFIESHRNSIINVISGLSKKDIEDISKTLENVDLVQTLFEYLWKNWEQADKSIYLDKVLKWVSFNDVNWSIDKKEIDKILKTMSWNEKTNILEIFNNLSWQKTDSMRFLTLVEWYDFLNKETLRDKINFYYKFLEILDKGDFETEELTVSSIYKKTFSPESKDYFFWEMTRIFEKNKQNMSILSQEVYNSFNEYISYSKRKKSFFSNLIWAFKNEEEIDLESKYRQIKSNIQEFKNELEFNKKEIVKSLEDIANTTKEVWIFKSKIINSSFKGKDMFIDWIETFERALSESLSRINMYKENFESLFTVLNNLNEKIKWLDIVVWTEVINNVKNKLEEDMKKIV